MLRVPAWLIWVAVFALLLSFPLYSLVTLWYSETKGPFKNWMQVVDLNGDGNLDVLVSHTRWEAVDISWAGIGRWINQGNGTFELIHDEQMEYFSAFAADAGDVDIDGDADLLTQDFNLHLLVNQGGIQEGQIGKFQVRDTLNSPFALDSGHPDMGGTFQTGDFNRDGRIDALVIGCCYGMGPIKTKDGFLLSPSMSWIWINDSEEQGFVDGHDIPMDFLNGIPIREAALGDIDGDGNLDVFAAVGKPTIGKTVSLSDLLLLNDGTGTLTISDQQLGNTDSTSVALADVNGDARLDALVGTTNGAKLWLNQNNKADNHIPVFTPSEQSFGGARLKAVFLADLDENGDMDALFAGTHRAVLWWNNGQGEFSESDIHFNYQEDTGLAVGDFDGDGDQDLFAGNNNGYYRIWFNDGNGNFSSAK